MKEKKVLRALSLFLVIALVGAMFVTMVSAETDSEYITDITPVEVDSKVTSFFNEKSDTIVKGSEVISLVDPEFNLNLTDEQEKILKIWMYIFQI